MRYSTVPTNIFGDGDVFAAERLLIRSFWKTGIQWLMVPCVVEESWNISAEISTFHQGSPVSIIVHCFGKTFY
jgi:hypothetical protein